MECDICHRSTNAGLRLFCEFCAQNAVYQPRLALAQSLIKNEGLEKDVEHRITAKNSQRSSFLGYKTQSLDSAWELDRYKADTAALDERDGDIQSHLRILRQEIQHMKLDIAKRKAHLGRRRKDLASAREELSKSQAQSAEIVHENVRELEGRIDAIHAKTAETAISRNAFVAWILGLQQLRLKGSSSPKDIIYFLGHNRIPNLKELNNAEPRKLSAVLLNIADIALQSARNLSLKLPAEIVLPTPEYAHAAIVSPNMSYTSSNPVLPGFKSPQPFQKGVDKAAGIDATQPRARPLFVRKKLSVLAKEDGPLYARHVEGITLLAWNVAWLCRTQGLNVGKDSWEGILNLGSNLYELLLGPGTGPSSTNTPLSNGTVATKGNAESNAPPRAFYSHGTHYGFLNSAEGLAYMRDWKLADPIKVINRVKAMLQAERMGAEWEILDDQEWRQQAEEEKTALDGRDSTRDMTDATLLEQTGVLVKPGVGGDLGIKQQEDQRGKMWKGWTRIRER